MIAIQQNMHGIILVLTPLEHGLKDNLGLYAIHHAIINNNVNAFKNLFKFESSANDILGNSIL